MKILDLLEAKFAKPIYAYHATKSEHLKSILKHGLIPNKSENGYGSSEESYIGYQLTPLSGTYFTMIADDAEHIANSLDDTQMPIIIIAKIQRNEADIDEDRLVTKGFNEDNLFKTFSEFLREMLEHYDWDYTEAMDSLDLQQRFQKLIDDEIIKLIKIIIKQHGITHTKFQEYIKSPIEKYVEALANFAWEQNFNDQGHAESDLRDAHEELTKKLRNIQRGNESKEFNTFKIDRPIGFSGASRIVGIFSPSTGKCWGDFGDIKGNIIKVKHPLEILRN